MFVVVHGVASANAHDLLVLKELASFTIPISHSKCPLFG